MSKNEPKSARWLFIAPILDLHISKELNQEFRLNQVTFIASQALPRRRRRFGLPFRLSEAKGTAAIYAAYAAGAPTLALMRLSGSREEMQTRFRDTLLEELAILASSQLGYSDRSFFHFPRPALKGGTFRESFVAIDTDSGWTSGRSKWKGGGTPLVLNRRWREFQKFSHFRALLRILRGDVEVSSSWRRNLFDAAVLVGQSITTLDRPQAFLWNMVALETLLTRPSDKQAEALPERVEAFLGWVQDWAAESFEERIREAYGKRCRLVHSGVRGDITPEDVDFTDRLTLNVLLNLCSHTRIIASKEELVAFCDQLRAERILGIRPRVRPRTLSYIR